MVFKRAFIGFCLNTGIWGGEIHGEFKQGAGFPSSPPTSLTVITKKRLFPLNFPLQHRKKLISIQKKKPNKSILLQDENREVKTLQLVSASGLEPGYKTHLYHEKHLGLGLLNLNDPEGGNGSEINHSPSPSLLIFLDVWHHSLFSEGKQSSLLSRAGAQGLPGAGGGSVRPLLRHTVRISRPLFAPMGKELGQAGSGSETCRRLSLT